MGHVRVVMVQSVLAMMVGVSLATGCARDISPLPPLSAHDVVGVLIGPSGVVLSEDTAISPVPDGISLGGVLDAYAESRETDWEGDTTPQLSAILELRDGRLVILHFTEDYPRECAEVIVEAALGSDVLAAHRPEFRVGAPGLERAIRELADELGMPVELEP